MWLKETQMFLLFCFMNEKNRVSIKVVVRELGIRLLLIRSFKSNDLAESKNYTDRDNIL